MISRGWHVKFSNKTIALSYSQYVGSLHLHKIVDCGVALERVGAMGFVLLFLLCRWLQPARAHLMCADGDKPGRLFLWRGVLNLWHKSVYCLVSVSGEVVDRQSQDGCHLYLWGEAWNVMWLFLGFLAVRFHLQAPPTLTKSISTLPR